MWKPQNENIIQYRNEWEEQEQYLKYKKKASLQKLCQLMQTHKSEIGFLKRFKRWLNSPLPLPPDERSCVWILINKSVSITNIRGIKHWWLESGISLASFSLSLSFPFDQPCLSLINWIFIRQTNENSLKRILKEAFKHDDEGVVSPEDKSYCDNVSSLLLRTSFMSVSTIP